VRGLQTLGDLTGDRQRLVEKNRSACETLGQILAVHILERERDRAISFFEAMNRRDVGMIEGCQDLGFTAEARDALGILCEAGRKHFDRGVTIEPRIACAKHLAHPAGAERSGHFIRPDPGTNRQGIREADYTQSSAVHPV
jgi:hypothetical protein